MLLVSTIITFSYKIELILHPQLKNSSTHLTLSRYLLELHKTPILLHMHPFRASMVVAHHDTQWRTVKIRKFRANIFLTFKIRCLQTAEDPGQFKVVAIKKYCCRIYSFTYVLSVDVLCRQPIKLFQVVSTSEFHEY